MLNQSSLSSALTVFFLGCLIASIVRYLKVKREKTRLLKELENQRSANRALKRQLAENESRLRVIIESEPELVLLQDADGKVLEMNPAGLSIAGAEIPEEIVGRSIFSIVAPEFRGSYKTLSKAVFRGEARILEFRVVGLRESVHWLEMHAFPIRNVSNCIMALTGIARDITQRKHAEEAAKRHQIELAHVTRLTTMGEMASGIAHELNQPLSAISNFADGSLRRIRRNSARQEGLIEALEQICHQADRAGHIIRHMRNFARKRDANWTQVDINTVVQEVFRFLEPEARQNCIVIRLELASEQPLVSGDFIELEQVMVNLVRNAMESIIDSTQEGREICINTTADMPKIVEVSVADNGPGVPPEVAKQLFDPFYTSKASGMGMGLSISRSIIEAHEGRLWLSQTKEDSGARFVFTLPAISAM